MSISANCLKNSLAVRAYGKPFYASDLGLKGGEITGLLYHGFIKPTGNTKKEMIPIDCWSGDDIYREVEVKEWVCCEDNPYLAEIREHELNNLVKQAKAILNWAKELGIEV
jgi:hypothetical protein